MASDGALTICATEAIMCDHQRQFQVVWSKEYSSTKWIGALRPQNLS